ncbi:MAG TPA: hypothetical protein PK175_01175 [Syntrophales bacterium]|nr:hypothetical protein [Syntrophales bacterium]HOU76715.1 hypothetical protein [Syntrophales bacterium]HQG33471.1 hypothetical protein [Syntrophales bacterium]HQI34673.1 hypothetical protein [Syntrophales bacterium]
MTARLHGGSFLVLINVGIIRNVIDGTPTIAAGFHALFPPLLDGGFSIFFGYLSTEFGCLLVTLGNVVLKIQWFFLIAVIPDVRGAAADAAQESKAHESGEKSFTYQGPAVYHTNLPDFSTSPYCRFVVVVFRATCPEAGTTKYEPLVKADLQERFTPATSFCNPFLY